MVLLMWLKKYKKNGFIDTPESKYLLLLKYKWKYLKKSKVSDLKIDNTFFRTCDFNWSMTHTAASSLCPKEAANAGLAS